MSSLTDQLRAEADAYEGAAKVNLEDNEWPEDSLYVRGNLDSAARLREAADRIEALEAALTEADENLSEVVRGNLNPNHGAAGTLVEHHAKIARGIIRAALVVRSDASEAPDAE